ncbi:MAG: phosphopantetheine-binding protein [Pseudomonadota bacterium]
MLKLINLDELRDLLDDVLQLGDRKEDLDENSLLLGEIPEFDSMAVMGVITEMEERYGIELEDDELDGELFSSVASLQAFINKKLA